MKISIFGTGYVGLVTGACLADLGNNVLCCDINQEKIDQLLKGEVPFYEPGLGETVTRNIKEQRLVFSTDPKKAVGWGDLLFIAVGTPSLPSGEADVSFVDSVIDSIGKHLDRDNVVVVTKSTVPVGTTRRVRKNLADLLEKRGQKYKFAVVNNPEFLRQGRAVSDFNIPSRIVIGSEDDWARDIMAKLYNPYTKNGHPIYFMDSLSSELSKYTANSFIAARISLINEIAQICERVGADVESVRTAVGADERIGSRYLYPGVGYGGSCFPKDVQALASLARQLELETRMIEHIELVNEKQKDGFADKIAKELGGVAGKKIAVWGLSFKPHTDDMRSAPSVKIIESLLKQKATVAAYDPVAKHSAKKIFGDRITITDEMYECLKNADALVVLTEWPQFKEPDFEKIKKLLKEPVVFDGRNIYEPWHMRDLGFTYLSVGRKKITVKS